MVSLALRQPKFRPIRQPEPELLPMNPGAAVPFGNFCHS